MCSDPERVRCITVKYKNITETVQSSGSHICQNLIKSNSKNDRKKSRAEQQFLQTWAKWLHEKAVGCDQMED